MTDLDVSEYKIPKDIINEKDVVALSDYTLEKYGKAIDKRLGWDNAHRIAINMRRVAVRNLEQQEKDVIMDKTKWPWIEGYKFFCDGPNPAKNNGCYVTNIEKNTQTFVPDIDLVKYLAEGFEPPAPAAFKHESSEEIKRKAKEAEAAAKAAQEAAEAEKQRLHAEAVAAKAAAKEAARLAATQTPEETPPAA